MRTLKFGFLLVATVAFATPACFSVAKDDDDEGEGGESGEGSGGSSGSSGGSSGSSSGSSGSGGSSGSSSGSSGSGGTGSGTCNTSSYELPVPSCPSGSVTFLDDPTCYDFFSCLVAASCADAGSECSACLSSTEEGLATTFTCTQGTTSGYADACIGVSQMPDYAEPYPECVLGGG